MKTRTFKPEFDILEEKITPSVSFGDGVVYVTGTNGNDIFIIEETKDSFLLNGKFLANKSEYSRVVVDVKTGNDVVLIEPLGPNLPLITSITAYSPAWNNTSGGVVAGASVGNKYSQSQFEAMLRQSNGNLVYEQYIALKSPLYYAPDDITLPAGGLPYLVTDVAYVANYPINNPNDLMYNNLMRVAEFNGRPNFLNEAKFLVLSSTEMQTTGMLWVTYGSMDYSQLNDTEQLEDMREYVDRLFSELSDYGFSASQRQMLANKVLGYDYDMPNDNSGDNFNLQRSSTNNANSKTKQIIKNKTKPNKPNKSNVTKISSVRKR